MARAPKKTAPMASPFEPDAAAPVETVVEQPTAEENEVLEGEVLAEGTDIVAQVGADPTTVFADAKRFDLFFDKVKANALAEVPDTTTTKGRIAIRSAAADIVKFKTGIDRARMKLTEDMRVSIAKINDAGHGYTDKLADLAKEIRQPLTDWEEADKKRREEADAKLKWIQAQGAIILGDTSEGVETRLAEVENFLLDAELFGDLLPAANAAWRTAVDALTTGLERIRQDEANQRELDRLRQEAAQREQEEADRQAEQRRRDEEAEAERKRIADEAMADLRRQLEAANAKTAAAEALAETARQEAVEAERKRVAQEQQAELERQERELQQKRQEEAQAAETERLAVVDRIFRDLRIAADPTNLEALKARQFALEETGLSRGVLKDRYDEARELLNGYLGDIGRQIAALRYAEDEEAIRAARMTAAQALSQASFDGELVPDLSPEQALIIVCMIDGGDIPHLSFNL